MTDQEQPQQSQEESIGGGGNRQPAHHALRDAAKRLRSRADDLDAIADGLERCLPKEGYSPHDGYPFIGVGSGAEIALWRLAGDIR